VQNHASSFMFRMHITILQVAVQHSSENNKIVQQ